MKIAINPVELLTWWEGRGGRRPLTQRALAAKLGLSASTVRRVLQALRAAGHLDDTARARALAARGARRRGGRPRNPLDDADLLAVWSKSPNITAAARHLHVSRNRVRARLQQIGLRSEEIPRRRPQAPRRTEYVD